MFTYPALLWFLPVLGAVILIHLINMFRHRRINWAAMEFILVSYRKSRTRILLQQLLLMFLRTLAIATVILMFAGPKLEGKLAEWLGMFGKRGTHHIVLLDDSYSMNERNLAQGGMALFDDAIPVIQKIAELKPQDILTLLKLSSADSVLYELPLNTDGVQTVQTTLQRTHVSSAAYNPEKMLADAIDLVRQTIRHDSTVYFLSDFRRRDWGSSDSICKQIESIRQQGGNVRMIRVAQTEQPNLGIEQMSLVEGIHAADVDLLLDVTVANYGNEVAEGVLLTLFVDDQMQSQQTILRLAGGDKTTPPIRFPVRVNGMEFHRVEVRLQPDALPDDNRRYLALQVPDALEVLLITPPQSANTSSVGESSAQFIRTALAPGGVRSGIRVRQESPAYLVENPLEQFSAIFVLDIPTLEPSSVKALEDYVSSGGGVAFFPGQATDLDFVRNFLYKSGSGLFPAYPIAVQELLPDYLTKAADLRIVSRSTPHPIFRLFSDGESPLLGSVIIEWYLAIEQAITPDVNVWATLRNDAPLVLEKSFGRGKTMTFLTSASPDWNNWGRSPSFVIVLLELTAWLSKQQEQSQTLIIGDPLSIEINPTEYEERVQFVPLGEGEPGNSEIYIDAVPVENASDSHSWKATFHQTVHPGFYTVQIQSRSAGNRTELKAVNVNASEGDLRQMDVTEISDILRRVHQPLESAQGFRAASDFAGGQSVSDWLLYAVIVFLLGETFLAGRVLPPSRR